MNNISNDDFIIPILVEFVENSGSPLERNLQGIIVGYNPRSDECYVRVNNHFTYNVQKRKLFKVEIPLEKMTYDDLVASSTHLIDKDWEIHSHIIDSQFQVLKIRKKYCFDEPHYNIDGYKYKDLFVGRDVIQNNFLKLKGYKIKK